MVMITMRGSLINVRHSDSRKSDSMKSQHKATADSRESRFPSWWEFLEFHFPWQNISRQLRSGIEFLFKPWRYFLARNTKLSAQSQFVNLAVDKLALNFMKFILQNSFNLPSPRCWFNAQQCRRESWAAQKCAGVRRRKNSKDKKQQSEARGEINSVLSNNNVVVLALFPSLLALMQSKAKKIHGAICIWAFWAAKFN